MDRLAALDTFVAVADRGSFAQAGRYLGQSPPAVTRTIAALERHLGVSLFRRTTRSVALTDEGAALLERAREMLARWREVEQKRWAGRRHRAAICTSRRRWCSAACTCCPW